jgi:subtilisin
MNGKLRVVLFFGILFLASVLTVSSALADESPEHATFGKPEKPGKPDKPTDPPAPTWDKDTLPHKVPWWNDIIDVEQQGYTGAGTVVVILDTGLVSNWMDYFPANSILTDYCRSYTNELRADRIDFDKDREGHGTAVTGTIIGYRLALQDGTEYWMNGVAEDAKIVMLRVLYWTSRKISTDDLANNWGDAINYARSLKAGPLSAYNMIISMSLGMDYTNDVMNSAISNAENEGIVVSTSAGNDGPSSDTTAYPANLQDCTSVAACGHDDYAGSYGLDGLLYSDVPENDFSGVFLSDFSSRGKVDIAGIGENMILPYDGSGYYYISGTSFSCPQTSGVFALMFEAHGSMSVAWLENHLQSTAYDMGYTVEEQGAGLIQADAAV